MDHSNGYEQIASEYLSVRLQSCFGRQQVARWAKSLGSQSTVLDVGCGNGIPVTQVLRAEGHGVYGIDASESMVQAFQREFPDLPVKCEAVQHSEFFNRQFDGVVAVGLVFLLVEQDQLAFLERVGEILQPGGRLLFTAPIETGHWNDVMTGRKSVSLGRDHYEQALAHAGMRLVEAYTDEGNSNYYSAELAPGRFK